jgi:hypothetical protein
MLVNHLGHGVLEQNHILIERLDLPLQANNPDTIWRLSRIGLTGTLVLRLT